MNGTQSVLEENNQIQLIVQKNKQKNFKPLNNAPKMEEMREKMRSKASHKFTKHAEIFQKRWRR
jgi:hypothetical protein